MTAKRLAHHLAVCLTCGARCNATNARPWAHHHARHHGHTVELQLGWEIKPCISQG